jgi:cbb3-type cytochrome oxidase subunit 1
MEYEYLREKEIIYFVMLWGMILLFYAGWIAGFIQGKMWGRKKPTSQP